jgi:hypothetical protein
MKSLFFLLPSLILVTASIYMACNNIDSWGWFLFGALALFVYPSGTKNQEKL